MGALTVNIVLTVPFVVPTSYLLLDVSSETNFKTLGIINGVVRWGREAEIEVKSLRRKWEKMKNLARVEAPGLWTAYVELALASAGLSYALPESGAQAVEMNVVKGRYKRSNTVFVGQVDISFDRETCFPYYPEWGLQCFTNKEPHAVYTVSL